METTVSWNRFGIIGAGRVAEALALALAKSSAEPIKVYDINPDRCAAFAQAIGRAEVASDMAEIAVSCDVILIAVPDDFIGAVASDLAARAPSLEGSLVFHVSGKCSVAVLEPLAAAGAMVAGIHPVMTFTGHPHVEAERLRTAWLAVTADAGAATARAKQIVAAIGGKPFDLPDAMRPLYHAALAHAANHLVCLMVDAAEMLSTAGLGVPLDIMRPIVNAALDNVLTSGFAALSGPLLRGDAGTIAGHLQAIDSLAPALSDAYRAMAKATLRQMAIHDMNDEITRARLKALLDHQ